MNMIPTEEQEQEALFEWVAVAGTNGRYFISNTGIVKRAGIRIERKDGVFTYYPEREMARSKDRKGYLSVTLIMSNGKRKSYKVHRLVMSAFATNNSNKPQINHIDSDKTNNKLENLEWVDQHENMEHSVVSGTKWTKPVRCTNDGNIFKSMRSAARYYDIGHKEISKCCHGLMRKIKGLSFEFISKKEAENGIYRRPRASCVV